MLSSIAVAVVLAASAWAVSSFRPWRRGGALSRVAQQIGFLYCRDGFGVPSVDAFNQGDGRTFCHLLTGRYAGTETMLFDYEYTPKSVDTDIFGFSRKKQTVAALHLKETLAEFHLAPKSRRRKVDTAGASGDIAFDDVPIFSQRYVLSGQDEAAIRRLFTPELRASLARMYRPWNIQSCDGWVIIYIARCRVEPPGITDFLSQVSNLFICLTGASTPARPVTATGS